MKTMHGRGDRCGQVAKELISSSPARQSIPGKYVRSIQCPQFVARLISRYAIPFRALTCTTQCPDDAPSVQEQIQQCEGTANIRSIVQFQRHNPLLDLFKGGSRSCSNIRQNYKPHQPKSHTINHRFPEVLAGLCYRANYCRVLLFRAYSKSQQ